VFIAFEETPEELATNVASLGFDLEQIEVLFAGLPDPPTLWNELRRLFWWIKDRGITTTGVWSALGKGSTFYFTVPVPQDNVSAA
jgi:hypothetical protein